MYSFYLHLPPIKRCFTGTLISCHTSKNPLLSAIPQSWRPQRSAMGISIITMRDRSKNRKPTQRGRYLSIEGIQAVQALKRAKVNGGLDAVAHEIETKVRRLVKFDLVSVLRELQRQGEAILAFQVASPSKREHWLSFLNESSGMNILGNIVKVNAREAKICGESLGASDESSRQVWL